MNCDELRALLGEGDYCQETDKGVRLLTHCLHTSFEQAAVYVRRWGDGFIVHDGGDAITAALRHGRDDAAMQTSLKHAVLRYGLTLDSGIITAKANDQSWLRSAVLSVANASAMASALAVEAVASKHERALHELILIEIKKVVPEQRITNGYHYRGTSGREWPIDFAVQSDHGPILLKGVTQHPNSISAGYTAFGDISANDNIPRFAVHGTPLSAENQALMRQVAQLVPLPSVEAGIRRIMAASL